MSQIQKQILYKAIAEPSFAKDVVAKIPTKTFDEDSTYKEFAIILNRYYLTNDAPLDFNTFLTLMESSLDKQGRSVEVQDTYAKSLKDIYELDYEMQNDDAIGEEIQKYVRKSLATEAIRKTLLESSLEEEGTIDKLIERLADIDQVNTLGNNLTVLDFFNEPERKKDLLKNIKLEKLPTGFFAFDTVAEGGIGRGELGLLIAKSGGGKTLIASNLASNSVKQGFNTVYFALEERTGRMVLRLEQILAQQTKANLMPNGELNEDLYSNIQDAYTQTHDKDVMQGKPWGDLLLYKFMPGELTPSMLDKVMSDLVVKQGKRIDVVIIDYPDLMNNPHLRTSENESRAGGRLYEDLRKYAQKYNYGCWALSQVNRTGFEKDVIDSSSIEGSKQKINACEVVLAVNQTPSEFTEGFIRLYVDKLRNSSGDSYEKMLQFKVLASMMTIRDESQEEYFAHQQVLNKQQEFKDKSYKKEKPSTQTANQKIEAMNGSLLGV